jgi:hypothetical protein
MPTRNVFVVATAMALASSPTFAEEWVSVSKDFQGLDEHTYEVLLDLSSVRENAEHPTIRTASVKYTRTQMTADEKRTNALAYSVTFKSFQCAARRIRLDAVEVHFSDGTVQTVDPGDDGSSWYAVDDPSASKLLDAVCSFSSPKPDGPATR